MIEHPPPPTHYPLKILVYATGILLMFPNDFDLTPSLRSPRVCTPLHYPICMRFNVEGPTRDYRTHTSDIEIQRTKS